MKWWSNKVELRDQTNNRVVVREPPSYGPSAVFLALGILMTILTTRGQVKKEGLIVGAVACAWVFFLGLYSLVESTFTVARDDATLRVRKSLLWFETTRRYPLEDVKGVVLRQTWMHGEGLRLQLISGKTEDLTISLHFQSLSDMQLALDRSVQAFRMTAKQP